MKKTYITPELQLLMLEQSDIITASSPVDSGDPGEGGGGNQGGWDDWE